MRIIPAFVLLLSGTSAAQTTEMAARVLAHLYKSSRGPATGRPTILAVVGSRSDTTGAATPAPMRALLPFLERAGVPISFARPPRGDTLVLEATMPTYDAADNLWFVGYSARACIHGKTRGYRTQAAYICTTDGCRHAPFFADSPRDSLPADPCTP